MSTIPVQPIVKTCYSYTGAFNDSISNVPLRDFYGLLGQTRSVDYQLSDISTEVYSTKVHQLREDDIPGARAYLDLVLKEVGDAVEDFYIDSVMFFRMYWLFSSGVDSNLKNRDYFLYPFGSVSPVTRRCHICDDVINIKISSNAELIVTIPDVSDLYFVCRRVPMKYSFFRNYRPTDDVSFHDIITGWVPGLKAHIEPHEYYAKYLEYERKFSNRIVCYHPFQQNGHFHVHAINFGGITMELENDVELLHTKYEYFTLAHVLNMMSKTSAAIWDDEKQVTCRIKGPYAPLYLPLRWNLLSSIGKKAVIFCFFFFGFRQIPMTYFHRVMPHIATYDKISYNNKPIYNRLFSIEVDIELMEKLLVDNGILKDGVIIAPPIGKSTFKYYEVERYIDAYYTRTFTIVPDNFMDVIRESFAKEYRFIIPKTMKHHYLKKYKVKTDADMLKAYFRLGKKLLPV